MTDSIHRHKDWVRLLNSQPAYNNQGPREKKVMRELVERHAELQFFMTSLHQYPRASLYFC